MEATYNLDEELDFLNSELEHTRARQVVVDENLTDIEDAISRIRKAYDAADESGVFFSSLPLLCNDINPFIQIRIENVLLP